MMIAVIFFILASTLLVLGLAAPAAREYRIGTDAVASRKSFSAGESGVEDAYYRIKNSIPLGTSTFLRAGTAAAITTITSVGGGADEIVGAGTVGGSHRSTSLKVSIGTGIPFQYGAEADDGGLSLLDTATIHGAVHSNGGISGEDGTAITGAAISADTSLGVTTTITGVDATHLIHIGTGGTDDATAHTIDYANVTGTLHCTSSTGSSGSCVPHPDPAYTALPISSTNITDWKTDAASGGTISGSYSVSTSGVTLGPKKITGDLTIPAGANLTLSGALWVTGDLVISGSGSINLSSSFGANSGVIIVDGTITVGNSGLITGSGTAGSYVMLLSSSPTAAAIDYLGSGAAILYAPSGTVTVSGTGSAVLAAGNSISLRDTASILYDPALISTVIVTGSSNPPGILSWKQTR